MHTNDSAGQLPHGDHLEAAHACEMKTKAMIQLRTFPRTECGLVYWSDSGGVRPKVLNAAELGDLTDLRQFYESDCAY